MPLLLMLLFMKHIFMLNGYIYDRVLDSIDEFCIYIYCCESHPFCLKMLPFLWVTCRWSWVVGGGSISRALIRNGMGNVVFVLHSFMHLILKNVVEVYILLNNVLLVEAFLPRFCWGLIMLKRIFRCSFYKIGCWSLIVLFSIKEF